MAKRRLVEISPAQFQTLSQVRNLRKRRGMNTPSMPVLVQECISAGMGEILTRYTPFVKET